MRATVVIVGVFEDAVLGNTMSRIYCETSAEPTRLNSRIDMIQCHEVVGSVPDCETAKRSTRSFMQPDIPRLHSRLQNTDIYFFPVIIVITLQPSSLTEVV